MVPGAHCDATHANMLVAPGSSVVERGGHVWHTLAFVANSAELYEPMAQRRHVAALSATVTPASAYEPAGHGVHADWPGTAA